MYDSETSIRSIFSASVYLEFFSRASDIEGHLMRFHIFIVHICESRKMIRDSTKDDGIISDIITNSRSNVIESRRRFT